MHHSPGAASAREKVKPDRRCYGEFDEFFQYLTSDIKFPLIPQVHGQKQTGGQSPDSGNNTSSSPVESASSPACTGRSCSEFEYSESSDLEGCERVERIRSKTAINVSRIPSMCVITPPGSDDEASTKDDNFRGRLELRNDVSSPGSVLMSATVGTSKMELIDAGQDKNPYATVQTVVPKKTQEEKVQASSKVSPLSGVLGKLRFVLPGGKRISPSVKSHNQTETQDSGDYVTIADVRNNNNKRSSGSSAAVNNQETTATYANYTDVLKKDAEYVSLSELPKKQDSSLERRRQGARVTLDSEGKVVYSSDSLKRRKGAHTTFNPGEYSPVFIVFRYPHGSLFRSRSFRQGRNIADDVSPPSSSPGYGESRQPGPVRSPGRGRRVEINTPDVTATR